MNNKYSFSFQIYGADGQLIRNESKRGRGKGRGGGVSIYMPSFNNYLIN